MARPTLSPVHQTRAVALGAVDSQPPAVKLPLDAKPQLVVTATGKHRNGVLNALSSVILERGGSITAAKRTQVEDIFSAMLAVWLPPRRPSGTGIEPDTFKILLENSVGVDPRLQNFNLQVSKLDYTTAAVEPSRHRLRLEAPQKPGIVNSLTEVFLSFDCVITSFEADVINVGNAVAFLAKGVIDVPQGAEEEVLTSTLREWAEANSAKLTFDLILGDAARL